MTFKRQFWGIVLILLGVLALLQMSGIHLGLTFFSVLSLCIGLAILWHGVQRASWFALAVGLWLGGIGLFDILYAADVTTISGGDIARGAWPLVLMAIGLAMLFGRKAWGFSGARFRVSAEGHYVGDLRYGQGNWTLDQDLNLEHGVGDVKLDLTTADITPGPHSIRVNSWIGEVYIRVPDNVTVYVDAGTNIGELEVLGDRRDGLNLSLTREAIVADAPAELHIDAKLGIGALRIVQRPAAVRFVP